MFPGMGSFAGAAPAASGGGLGGLGGVMNFLNKYPVRMAAPGFQASLGDPAALQRQQAEQANTAIMEMLKGMMSGQGAQTGPGIVKVNDQDGTKRAITPITATSLSSFLRMGG